MNTELILIRIPVILLSLTVHEYAHGYMAWLRGDNTAKEAGRLTFNPFAHLDLFGTLMLFLGPFGWAKPVPVNPYNLDNPRRDMKYVSFAGPASNMILGLIFGMTYRFLILNRFLADPHSYLVIFLQLGILINMGLSFFNLLPIPPLDGSKILMGILPPDKVGSYLKAVQHAPKIFLILIVAEWWLHIRLFSLIIYPLWLPYFNIWQFIIFGRKVF